MNFDRKLEYQFGFFLGTEAIVEVRREEVLELKNLFGAKVRFGDAAIGDSYVQHGGQVMQLPTVSWGVGGVWRMVWTPLRFDVVADALQYASVAEKEISLSMARDRLALGLERAAELFAKMGTPVHRLLLNFNADASESDPQRALRRVARGHFATDVHDAIASGSAVDVGYRIDWGGTFELGPSVGSVPVHRIENIGTLMTFAGPERRPGTRLGFDVNTSPSRGDSPLPVDSFAPFFAQACEWVLERLRKFEVEGTP